MKNFLLLLLSTSVLGSCVSISTLDIHVLEPATDPISPYISSVSLVNRTNPDAKEFNNDDPAEKFKLEVAARTLQSLALILNESPGIEYLDTGNIIYEGRGPGSIVDLCREKDTDAVLSLEFLRMQYHDTIMQKPGVKDTQWFDYYHGEVNLIFTVFWRAYAGDDGYPFDEFSLTDTLTWEYASYTRAAIGMYLPSLNEAFMEAAYLAALIYARRIFPYWIEEERSYFTRGNLRMRRAAGYISNIQLDQAEMILLELLNRRNTNTVAAAYHNLALIYELRGDYREALVLARKSYQYRMHQLMAQYIEILEERLEKSHELDRQLGRAD